MDVVGFLLHDCEPLEGQDLVMFCLTWASPASITVPGTQPELSEAHHHKQCMPSIHSTGKQVCEILKLREALCLSIDFALHFPGTTVKSKHE